jgi:hypothetical protein
LWIEAQNPYFFHKPLLINHLKKFAMKQLEGLKQPFLEMLEKATVMYKLVGMGDRESPMWYQLRLDKSHENSLLFQSSLSEVWICIECTKLEFDYARKYYDKAYDYFKRLKYTYLKENHPTVWNEQGTSNMRRVEAFLESAS